MQNNKRKKRPDLARLSDLRVVQRNLVYVTNLSVDVAKEEILRKSEHFGKFGKVVKVVVNRDKIYSGPQGPSVSCYITYSHPQEALQAIKTVDGTTVDGRLLRASFGTTKYCTYFLRGIRCPNSECMYLHQMGIEADSFTKEDMAQGKHLLCMFPDQRISGAQHDTNGQGNVAVNIPASTNGQAKQGDTATTSVWAAKVSALVSRSLTTASVDEEEFPPMDPNAKGTGRGRGDSVQAPTPLTTSTPVHSQPSQSQPHTNNGVGRGRGRGVPVPQQPTQIQQNPTRQRQSFDEDEAFVDAQDEPNMCEVDTSTVKATSSPSKTALQLTSLNGNVSANTSISTNNNITGNAHKQLRTKPSLLRKPQQWRAKGPSEDGIVGPVSEAGDQTSLLIVTTTTVPTPKSNLQPEAKQTEIPKPQTPIQAPLPTTASPSQLPTASPQKLSPRAIQSSEQQLQSLHEVLSTPTSSFESTQIPPSPTPQHKLRPKKLDFGEDSNEAKPTLTTGTTTKLVQPNSTIITGTPTEFQPFAPWPSSFSTQSQSPSSRSWDPTIWGQETTATTATKSQPKGIGLSFGTDNSDGYRAVGNAFGLALGVDDNGDSRISPRQEVGPPKGPTPRRVSLVGMKESSPRSALPSPLSSQRSAQTRSQQPTDKFRRPSSEDVDRGVDLASDHNRGLHFMDLFPNSEQFMSAALRHGEPSASFSSSLSALRPVEGSDSSNSLESDTATASTEIRPRSSSLGLGLDMHIPRVPVHGNPHVSSSAPFPSLSTNYTPPTTNGIPQTEETLPNRVRKGFIGNNLDRSQPPMLNDWLKFDLDESFGISVATDDRKPEDDTSDHTNGSGPNSYDGDKNGLHFGSEPSLYDEGEIDDDNPYDVDFDTSEETEADATEEISRVPERFEDYQMLEQEDQAPPQVYQPQYQQLHQLKQHQQQDRYPHPQYQPQQQSPRKNHQVQHQHQPQHQPQQVWLMAPSPPPPGHQMLPSMPPMMAYPPPYAWTQLPHMMAGPMPVHGHQFPGVGHPYSLAPPGSQWPGPPATHPHRPPTSPPHANYNNNYNMNVSGYNMNANGYNMMHAPHRQQMGRGRNGM